MSGYKQYLEYKSTGVDWIGGVPSHWNIVALHFVSSLKSGSSITSLEFNEDGEYPVYGGNGFRGYIDVYTHDGEYVLIGRQGALCGNVNLAYGKFFASEHAIVVHPTKSFNVRWMSYLLTSMDLNQYSVAAAQPGLSAEVIGRLKILFPIRNDQDGIADFLDYKTAQIDALIAKKEELLLKLQEKRAALIAHVVTKGLNSDAPMKDSGVVWLGQVPSHWSVKKLKFVAKPQPSNVDKKTVEGEVQVRLCNYTDVYKNEFINASMDFMEATATIDEINKFKLDVGDVIVTKDSETPQDIAVPALVVEAADDLVCGYHLTQIKQLSLNGRYLFRLLQSKGFNAQFIVQANGVTRFGIPSYAIDNARTPIPPSDEQKQISDFIDSKTAEIDEQAGKVKEVISKLREYRSALITNAVTGKIDVRDIVIPTK